MAEIESVYSKLVLDASSFHKSIERASEGLKHFAEESLRVSTAMNGLSGLGGILSGGGVIAGLGELVKSSFESIETQVRLSKELGTTAESLSQLQYAATRSNVSVEAFQGGMLRLSRSLGGAESSITQKAVAFEKFGLNARELAAMPLASAFAEIAEKIADTSSATERSAMAFALFGRKGQELLPVLLKGRQGVQELMQEADRLGLTLTESSVHKFEEAEHASKRLEAAWKSLGQTLTVSLSPGMATFSTGLEGVVRGLKAAWSQGGEEGSPLRHFLNRDKFDDFKDKNTGAGINNLEAEQKKAEEYLSMLRQADRLMQDLGKNYFNRIDQKDWSEEHKKLEEMAKLLDDVDKKSATSLRDLGKTFDTGTAMQGAKDRIKNIQDEIEILLKSADYVERRKLAEKGVKEELIKQLQTVQEQLEAQKQLQQHAEQIDQINREMLDPAQRFQQEMEKLSELKSQGLGDAAANLKGLDLVKGLLSQGSQGHQLAGAVMSGSAEDVHMNNIERVGDAGKDLQQRIVDKLEELRRVGAAQAEAAERAAQALQNLGLIG